MMMNRRFKVLDLFSGIGGFSLGLERSGGFEAVAFCEIDPFPRRVLAKHWPEVPIYNDVCQLTADILRRDGIAVDVITGGFPCQDLSVAGKQRGMGEGTRSGLWSEIIRLVGELRPSYVIVENVAALLSGPSERRGGWFGRVLGDLAECGYDAEWENIPASALGAPHRRERVWLVAFPNCRNGKPGAGDRPRIWNKIGCKGPDIDFGGSSDELQIMANAHKIKQEWGTQKTIYGIGSIQGKFTRGCKDIFNGWPVEPDVGRVANGVSNRAHRLAALGNAVVPQIPELIGRAIMKYEAN